MKQHTITDQQQMHCPFCTAHETELLRCNIQHPWHLDGVMALDDARRLATQAGLLPEEVAEIGSSQFAKNFIQTRGGYSQASLYRLLAGALALGSEDAVNHFLQTQGYDGVTYLCGGGEQKHRVWMAFAPKK